MKIGDLVRYSGRIKRIQQHTEEIGVVTGLRGNNVITVLWNNGVESNHSSGWIVRIKEVV